MDKKLYKLHETFAKHSVQMLACFNVVKGYSNIHPCIGYCSCGTIHVSNRCGPETWYRMASKAIDNYWLKTIEPVVASNKQLRDAYAALPQQHYIKDRKGRKKAEPWIITNGGPE
jgi:hypothetical protein